jgi:cytosine/creatinine deaminase
VNTIQPARNELSMVTTLSPCWYCSGLVRQFGIGQVVIGESVTLHGGHDWRPSTE